MVRHGFVFLLLLTLAGWALAEAPAFTSNVTALEISFPTGHFIEKGTVLNVMVELTGEPPLTEDGATGAVALETYDLNGKRLAVTTVNLPEGGATPPPGIPITAPGKPGAYVMRAVIRVHTKQGLYADMESKRLPFYVFQRPKVAATKTVELDAKGGIVALDKQPKAPKIAFMRGALTGPCMVTIELLDALPIPPINPGLKLWGKSVNIRIDGAEIAEDARIFLISPVAPTDKQAVLATYLLNGAWIANLVELNNEQAEGEATGFAASLPDMEVKDLLVFALFTVNTPQ